MRRLVPILTLSIPAMLAGQEVVVDSLILGSGDAVRVEMPDRPELAGIFQVANDGAILLPLLGFVEVEGRRFTKVREEIESRYRAANEESALRVTPLVRVMVQGQVNRPGVVTVDPEDRIGVVLNQAGGLSASADPRRIRLVREGQVVTLLDLETRPVAYRFRPGDRVVVEQAPWIHRHASAFIQALGSIAAAAVAGLIFR